MGRIGVWISIVTPVLQTLQSPIVLIYLMIFFFFWDNIQKKGGEEGRKKGKGTVRNESKMILLKTQPINNVFTHSSLYPRTLL